MLPKTYAVEILTEVHQAEMFRLAILYESTVWFSLFILTTDVNSSLEFIHFH